MKVATAVVGAALGIPIVLWREGNRFAWRIERDHYRAMVREEVEPMAKAWAAEKAAEFDRLLGNAPDTPEPE